MLTVPVKFLTVPISIAIVVAFDLSVFPDQMPFLPKLGLWLIGLAVFALLYWYCIGLKFVSLDDHALHISDWWHGTKPLSLQTIYQPVPVEGTLDHDLQIGFVGREQPADFRQLSAQFLLDHHLQLFVDHTHVTIPLHLNRFRSRTSSEAASFFGRKVGKANAVCFVRFRPPLLIIKSLDRSGGCAFRIIIGPATLD
jgi:hypothetical protein